MAKGKMTEDEIVTTILTYRDASDNARSPRLEINQFNWDIYNGKQDFSYKVEGQSQEFLPKLANAVEHVTSVMQSGLTSNSDDWFTVEEGINVDDVFDKDTNFKIMRFYLDQMRPVPIISNIAKCAGLDSRITVKVTGNEVNVKVFAKQPIREPEIKPEEEQAITENLDEKRIKEFLALKEQTKKAGKPKIKDKKVFRLNWELVDYVDFYTDPRPNPEGPLYNMQEIAIDYHVLLKLAEKYPDKYDVAKIKAIKESYTKEETQIRKDAKQNRQYASFDLANRRKVMLTEFWGTILDSNGKATESLTNVMCIMANDKVLIRGPEKIDELSLDGTDPFVTSTLLNIPGAVEGKGFFDAAAELNATLNEAYNLMLDGMMDSIKGVKEVRPGLLKNPNQVSKGLTSGTVLIMEDDVPNGVHAYEKCPTGVIPNDGYTFYRYCEELVNEASFMNELKVGNLPAASTKATIATLADQAISGVFASIIKVFEDKLITPLLEKSWKVILESINEDNINEDELTALIGNKKALQIMGMSREERFLRGANAARFKVRGISSYLQKSRDFQKYTNFLQTVSANPVLFQKFAEAYSIPKFVKQILGGTGIREEQVRLTDEEAKIEKIRNAFAKALADAQVSKGQTANTKGAGQQASPSIPEEETPITSQGPQGPMEGNYVPNS